MIRDVREEDAEALCEIHNHYVSNTIITFEEETVTREEMHYRIQNISASCPWLIYEDHGVVLGYAYANRWKSRCAYQYAVESSIYLSPNSIGKGIGSKLYAVLIDRLRASSLHSVLAGIALPNPASVALHEKMGFEKVAHFKEVGWKMNRWVDVGYWELIIRNAEHSACLDDENTPD